MKQHTYLSLAVLILASWLSGSSCSKSDDSYGNPNPQPPTGNNNNISINGMSFSPASKTVKKGSVVKWTNNDYVAHTATSNNGITFDSGGISSGGSYSYTADSAGTFQYHCTYHGTQMAGTLVVNQ